LEVEARVEARLHEVAVLVHEHSFQRRLAMVSLASLVHFVFYFSANHWPRSEGQLLPMTMVDELVPFLPWTIFPYVSAYGLVFVSFLSLRKASHGVRFLQVFIACVLIAGALHWAFPTRYPRELFPIPEGTDALSAGMVQVVRFFDTPSSCLPSLHVAISFASALLVWRERKGIFWALLAWSLVIAASTLTTKQHYLIDVLSGALLAVLVTLAVDARGWWVARSAEKLATVQDRSP
jgi:membrane-associated phospholipid phosphatase